MFNRFSTLKIAYITLLCPLYSKIFLCHCHCWCIELKLLMYKIFVSVFLRIFLSTKPIMIDNLTQKGKNINKKFIGSHTPYSMFISVNHFLFSIVKCQKGKVVYFWFWNYGWMIHWNLNKVVTWNLSLNHFILQECGNKTGRSITSSHQKTRKILALSLILFWACIVAIANKRWNQHGDTLQIILSLKHKDRGLISDLIYMV